MIAYDETKLLAELQRLSPLLRVIFAAACAERQMPAYRAFIGHRDDGDSNELVLALNDVWTAPASDNAAVL